jgi:hypothetical protein
MSSLQLTENIYASYPKNVWFAANRGNLFSTVVLKLCFTAILHFVDLQVFCYTWTSCSEMERSVHSGLLIYYF